MACQLVLLTSTSASLFRSMASLSILPSLITPQQLSACWTCSDVVSELSVVLATEKHEGVDRTNKSNNSSSYRDIKKTPPTKCSTCFVTVQLLTYHFTSKEFAHFSRGCSVQHCCLTERRFWIRGHQLGPICIEFTCSPRFCMSSLWMLLASHPQVWVWCEELVTCSGCTDLSPNVSWTAAPAPCNG